MLTGSKRSPDNSSLMSPHFQFQAANKITLFNWVPAASLAFAVSALVVLTGNCVAERRRRCRVSCFAIAPNYQRGYWELGIGHWALGIGHWWS
ncbi:MAG: hypothetical protein ACYTXE_33825 [Nostoc sp.]